MKRNLVAIAFFVVVVAFSAFAVAAQSTSPLRVLAAEELPRIVPGSFYFAGQSAETQARNSAAATIGKDRYIIVGLVDTSGYSSDISGKYEGFFITDSPVRFGNRILGTGAYGFGFAANGRARIFDLSSREILSVPTVTDVEMKRPRPIQMVADKKGIRLYKGKAYVLISPR